jgi:prophage regulatory protein
MAKTDPLTALAGAIAEAACALIAARLPALVRDALVNTMLPIPTQSRTPPTVGHPRRVIRLREVIARTGLKRDTIYRLGREGTFPKVIKLTERASGWSEGEIDEWVARIANKR